MPAELKPRTRSDGKPYNKADLFSNRKVCPKCLKSLPLENFRPVGKKEYMSYCRDCQLKYFKEFNAKRYASPEAREAELIRGREKYEAIVKPSRRKRKITLVMMMGGKCVICGYNKNLGALDFDHINPKEKCRVIGNLLAINKPWAWETALEEAKKCQLLCANCHREKTYPDMELSKLEWLLNSPVALTSQTLDPEPSFDQQTLSFETSE